jgi:hypothetical protein
VRNEVEVDTRALCGPKLAIGCDCFGHFLSNETSFGHGLELWAMNDKLGAPELI